MTPVDLVRAINDHEGTFLCSRINHPSETKTVSFRHETTAPTGDLRDVPEVGRLRDFYAAFGSIAFYVDAKSGDSARHIASIAAWSALRDDFSPWIEGLSDGEREELLPEWIGSSLVLGEEPHSGNYVLMPASGAEAGSVFHFEHDGFEFTRQAGDLIQYAAGLLDLDDRALAYIATHMRFIDASDGAAQWWIEELRDNRGNVARTRV
jgi:hypothetical protein